jgi:hypothetical protein
MSPKTATLLGVLVLLVGLIVPDDRVRQASLAVIGLIGVVGMFCLMYCFIRWTDRAKVHMREYSQQKFDA